MVEALQKSKALISDSSQQGQDLRFPFFLVELKSGATGGTLYQAQNQAAGDATAAYNLFRSLHAKIVVTDRSASEEMYKVLPFIFALTSEGPIHELWVHWYDPVPSRFYMSRDSIRDVTVERDGCSLVHVIAKVLSWGDTCVRTRVV
jgi:hypothetical protein